MNKIIKLTLSAIIALTMSQGLLAQKWTPVKESTLDRRAADRQIIPQKYDVFGLDINLLRADLLAVAPGTLRSEATAIIELPTPGGNMAAFKMMRKDVFHPNLAARYPQIQAYTGYNVENPSQIVKLSMSHQGMDAMISGGGGQSVYIDRYANGDDQHYITYNKGDYSAAGKSFECSVEHSPKDYKDVTDELRFGDCTLRTYRLALACTAEYANFHGGTVEDVLAAYNTAMNRVNGLYETESAITMQLIENTDQLIFFDAATDPYTNDSGGIMLSQNQNTIDQIIGFSNYDIGHVFSTGGGGIASLRSPCTNRKAQGVTGLPSPVNDPFYVDYVAHEIGHQFGANHTYNNSCNNNRSNSTAVEPGSGATIMAYAGICAPNVQNNSDDYFHSVSLNEMANFVVAGAGGNCPVETALDNTPPSIVSLPDETVIPGGTPFVLTAAAEDPDTDQDLSYCWEQTDIEIATMPPVTTSTGGPAFRSYDPVASPSRYFPRLSDILNNTNGNTWERLSSSSRSYNFTVTVRDNAAGGGCTDFDEMTIEVDGNSGPFVVNQPTASSVWNSGSTEIVEWDVAGTDTAPVNCETVDIWLSATDERNFDILLAEGVPNDGSHEVAVPSVNTFDARVMVRCATSIFLDISNGDFAIVAPYEVVVSEPKLTVCPDQQAVYNLSYVAVNDFEGTVDFAVEGIPDGIVAELSQTSLDADGDFFLTLSNLQSVTPGRYPFLIRGTNPTAGSITNLELYIAAPDNVALTGMSPADGSRGLGLLVPVEWDLVPGNLGYQLQVSESSDFADLIMDQTVAMPSFELAGLDPNTVYYWRAAVLSPCYELDYLSTQAFQTFGLDCTSFENTDTIIITEADDNDLNSELAVVFDEAIAVASVSVTIEHDYVGDLTANITSPASTNVNLLDRAGVPESNFGCPRDNVNITFADAALNSYDDLENTCAEGADFAIAGRFQPLEALDKVAGETGNGLWSLNVTDMFAPDGGQLLSWSLELCSEIELAEAVLLRNEGKTLENEAVSLVTTDHIEISTSDNTLTTYRLISTGQVGSLQRFDVSAGGFVTMAEGSTFTQQDLVTEQIRYQFEGTTEDSDVLIFDIVNAENQWIQNVNFDVSINLSALAASAVVTSAIRCNGDTDAEVTITGLGGLPPYTYSLDGTTFTDDNVFGALAAGSYDVYIRDAIGSEEIIGVSIPEPAAITATANVVLNMVTVNASGGTGALSYSADGTVFQADNTFLLANEATYTITIRDESDCTLSLEDVVVNYLQSIAVSTTSPLCNGDETGTISVATTGGVQPFTFTLDGNMQDNGEFTDLAGGTYSLEVSDANAVIISQMVTVQQPQPLSLSIDTMVSTAVAVITGGTAPYVTTINGIEGEDGVFTELVNGDYEMEAIDANGCATSGTFTITGSNVSTQAIAAADIQLYPSPAIDRLTIVNNSNHSFATIEIVNIAGALVSTVPYSNILNIELLAPGTYIVRLTGEDAVATKRIVKVSP